MKISFSENRFYIATQTTKNSNLLNKKKRKGKKLF